MRVLLNGRLKYIGNHVYYHFTDELGCYQRLSIKIKVDKIEKNTNGELIFPANAYAVARQIDEDVRSLKWNMKKPAVKRTIQQLLDEYLSLDGSHIADSTKILYRNGVKKFIEIFGDIPINKINSDLMVVFRNSLASKDGYSNNDYTIAKEFRQMAALFSFAVRRSYISANPINRYNRPHPPRKMPDIYSESELSSLFNYLETNAPDAMNQIYFLLLTGFRVEESCIIKWDQIDWTNRCIMHHNQKGRRDELYPMSDVLLDFTKKLPRLYKPFIFKFRDRFVLHRQLKKARDAAGINRRKSIHLFKKNYSTGLANVGTPSYILPDLAHHTSINTTKDAYLYMDMEEKRKWLNESHNRLAEKLQKKSDENNKILPINASTA